jgi:acetyl esterase/lipase
MGCLFRWNGLTCEIGKMAVPGTTGHGDIGSPTGNSYISGNNLGPRLETKASNDANRVSGTRVVEANDYATGNDTFYWSIAPTATPGTSLPGIYSGPWSMRMMVRFPTPLATMSFLQWRRAGSTQFSMGRFISADRIGRVGSGNLVTLPSPSAWYRIEIQADPARTTQVVWRVYREDQTTPLGGYVDSGAGSAAEWDEMRIGYLSAGFSAIQAMFAEIEIHDDYDLGGLFGSSPQDGVTPASSSARGAPSYPPIVGGQYRYSASTNKTVARTSPSYTSHLNIDYATSPSVYGRRLDLFVPNGTPPSGGWPVLMWGHSGFFSEGSKSDLPANWRDEMLAAGYAIASVQYVKTTIDPVPTYDAYGTNDTDGPGFGRYPSFIIDYKVATVFLKNNAATYNLNVNKFFATGYSAGGYVALAAAMTRGLATDSAGTKLTIAGATADGSPWGNGMSDADPSYIGCMVFAAPIDMDLANSWDPTHPNSGSLIRKFAYRAFQGLVADGSATASSYPRQSIASHIGLNSLSNLCPVLYVRGTADFLVHWEHEDALADAMASKGGDYTVMLTPNNHDRANDIFDADALLGWLDALAYPDSGGGPTGRSLTSATGDPLSLFTASGDPLALD